MPRRMLCVDERVNERGEPAISKTCCKQSLEEGMSVAKKAHGGRLSKVEVAYVESESHNLYQQSVTMNKAKAHIIKCCAGTPK